MRLAAACIVGVALVGVSAGRAVAEEREGLRIGVGGDPVALLLAVTTGQAARLGVWPDADDQVELHLNVDFAKTPRRLIGFELGGRGLMGSPDAAIGTALVRQILGTLTLFSRDRSGFFITVGAGSQDVVGTSGVGIGLLARGGYEFLFEKDHDLIGVSVGATAYGGSPTGTPDLMAPHSWGVSVAAHYYFR
jgi:hypothetical protein